MKKIWLKSLRDIKSARARSLLLLLIISTLPISVTGFGLMISTLNHTVEGIYQDTNLADLIVRISPTDSSLVDALRGIEGVLDVEGRLVAEGSFDLSGRPVYAKIIGIRTDAPPKVSSLLVLQGSLLDSKVANQALAEEKLADVHGVSLGDKIVATIASKKVVYDIVGIVVSPEYLAGTANPAWLVPLRGSLGVVFVSIAELQEMLDQTSEINEVALRLDPNLQRQAEDLVKDALEPYGIIDFLPREKQFSYTFLDKDIDVGNQFARVFVIVFAITAGIVVFTTMSKLVMAQRPEIGMLKALGYRRRTVTASYLLTVVILAVIGTALGLGLSVFIGQAMAGAYAQAVGLPIPLVPTFSAEAFILGATAGISVPLAASFAPVYRVLKLAPRDSFLPVDVTGAPSRRTLKFEEALTTHLPLKLATMYGVRNFMRRKRRTVMTMAGIALAVVLIGSWVLPVQTLPSLVEDAISRERWSLAVDFRHPLPADFAGDLEWDLKPVSKTRAALENATRSLLSAQIDGSFWQGEMEHGRPTFSSMYLLTLRHLGLNDSPFQETAIRWLLSYQNPDGSWGISPVNTAMALLALETLDVPGVDDALSKGREALAAQGGLEGPAPGMDTAKVFYALFDRYPWQNIEHPPIEIVLEPPDSPTSIWSLYTPFHLDIVIASCVILTLNQFDTLTPRQQMAINVSEELLKERQLVDGSLFASTPQTALAVVAFYELGYGVGSFEITSALEFLSEMRSAEGWVQGFNLPVYDTALSVIALCESGFPESDSRLQRAVRYLEEAKHPSGAWGYSSVLKDVDVDDTALVLIALLKAGGNQTIMRSGLDWILRAQNQNGSWSTYNRTTPDPVTHGVPDVTGRVLIALGLAGYRVASPEVENAIAWLRQNQRPSGAWHALWGVTYSFGTSAVLQGLAAVGEDMSKPYVKKAVDWLKSRQNPDGGWGETYASYFDERFAGIGNSTAEQTAYALQALLAGGEPSQSEAIESGVKYLVRNQRAEGSWPEAYAVSYFFEVAKNHLYATAYPLWALGAYLQRLMASSSADVKGQATVEPYAKVFGEMNFRGRVEPYQVLALEEDYASVRFAIQSGTGDLRGTSMILSQNIAEKLGARVGDRVSLKLLSSQQKARDVTFNVTGISKEVTTMAYVSLSAAAYLAGQDFITGAFITTTQPKESRLALYKDPHVASVLDRMEFESGIREFLGAMYALIYVGLAVGMFMAFLFAFSSITVEILDRQSEYGLLRILGYKSGTVVKAVLAEALPLAFVGILLGAPLAAYVAQLIFTQMSAMFGVFGYSLLISGSDLFLISLPVFLTVLFAIAVAGRQLLSISVAEFLRTRAFG